MAKRSGSSRRWLERQRRDRFAQKASQQGQGSRAHFKLAQLDKRFRLIRSGQTILELGAAPGGWTAYLESCLKTGQLVVVDPREVAHQADTRWIQGAIGEPEVDKLLDNIFQASGADLVLSDMAPNISGIRIADQARSMELVRQAEEAADRYLKPGGDFVVKVFQGDGVDEWMTQLRRRYRQVKLAKPAASRAESREVYAVAREFLGLR